MKEKTRKHYPNGLIISDENQARHLLLGKIYKNKKVVLIME